MAIVNRTPDSFYDRGATFDDGPALEAIARVIEEGAAIVDIGGVKAGPGADVDVAEGRHSVDIRKSGYVGYVTDVQVRRGETTPLNVSLRTQDDR